VLKPRSLPRSSMTIVLSAPIRSASGLDLGALLLQIPQRVSLCGIVTTAAQVQRLEGEERSP
jgi:hypothetical protein